MSDEHDTEFDSADSGASATYPMQAGEIRKGSHLMIKGRPCKCIEVSTSKTGKHGHAKVHFVKRTEYQLLAADADSGEVSLLLESGETKDDLNLPTFVKVGEPTEDDTKVVEEILKGMEDGKQVNVIVQAACGEEKIVQTKVTDG